MLEKSRRSPIDPTASHTGRVLATCRSRVPTFRPPACARAPSVRPLPAETVVCRSAAHPSPTPLARRAPPPRFPPPRGLAERAARPRRRARDARRRARVVARPALAPDAARRGGARRPRRDPLGSRVRAVRERRRPPRGGRSLPRRGAFRLAVLLLRRGGLRRGGDRGHAGVGRLARRGRLLPLRRPIALRGGHRRVGRERRRGRAIHVPRRVLVRPRHRPRVAVRPEPPAERLRGHVRGRRRLARGVRQLRVLRRRRRRVQSAARVRDRRTVVVPRLRRGRLEPSDQRAGVRGRRPARGVQGAEGLRRARRSRIRRIPRRGAVSVRRRGKSLRVPRGEGALRRETRLVTHDPGPAGDHAQVLPPLRPGERQDRDPAIGAVLSLFLHSPDSFLRRYRRGVGDEFRRELGSRRDHPGRERCSGLFPTRHVVRHLL